jgi:hypothetical protein
MVAQQGMRVPSLNSLSGGSEKHGEDGARPLTDRHDREETPRT